jgi:hypothetical protein
MASFSRRCADVPGGVFVSWASDNLGWRARIAAAAAAPARTRCMNITWSRIMSGSWRHGCRRRGCFASVAWSDGSADASSGGISPTIRSAARQHGEKSQHRAGGYPQPDAHGARKALTRSPLPQLTSSSHRRVADGPGCAKKLAARAARARGGAPAAAGGHPGTPAEGSRATITALVTNDPQGHGPRRDGLKAQRR